MVACWRGWPAVGGEEGRIIRQVRAWMSAKKASKLSCKLHDGMAMAVASPNSLGRNPAATLTVRCIPVSRNRYCWNP